MGYVRHTVYHCYDNRQRQKEAYYRKNPQARIDDEGKAVDGLVICVVIVIVLSTLSSCCA
jgi:hypothetical protein